MFVFDNPENMTNPSESLEIDRSNSKFKMDLIPDSKELQSPMKLFKARQNILSKNRLLKESQKTLNAPIRFKNEASILIASKTDDLNTHSSGEDDVLRKEGTRTVETEHKNGNSSFENTFKTNNNNVYAQ